MARVLITGGATGIGRATAIELNHRGADVIAHYFKSEAAAKRLEEDYAIKTVRADITSFDEVMKAFSALDADVLVNCAGVSLVKLVLDTSESEYDSVQNVNMKGTFHACRAVLGGMTARRQGKIINVSSMWGNVGASMESIYSASKAAVIGFTKSLAREMALMGITVNCVCPGAVRTDMLSHYTQEDMKLITSSSPFEKIAEPEDVAKLIATLALSDLPLVSGQIISINDI